MSKKPTFSASGRLFDWLFIALLIAVPLVWSSEFVFVAYYPKLLAFHLGLAALYLAWILKSRAIIRSSLLILPTLLYLALIITSVFWAENRMDALIQVSHRLGLVLLFFALLNNLRAQDTLRHTSVIAVIGIAVAQIGIAQYAGWGPFWKIPSTGLPSSTLGYRNYAAMFTILCIPLCALHFLEARHPKAQWLWGLGNAVLITFLICTRTRGAWVGLTIAVLAAAIAMLLIKTHDGQRLWRSCASSLAQGHLAPGLSAALAVVLFVMLVGPNMRGMGYDRNRPDKAYVVTSVASMFDTENDPQKSVQHRLRMWRNTFDMVADAPLLGVGIGNWHIAYPAYDGGDVIWEYQAPVRPHNDYVWIAGELGLMGLLAYAYLLGTVFFITFRLVRSLNRSRVRQPLFIAMSLVALLGHAFFSFPRERIAVTMLFWTLLAFLAVFDAENRPAARHSFWPKTRWPALFALLFCCAISFRALQFDIHFARASRAVDRTDWHDVLRETSQAIARGIFDSQALLLRGAAHTHLGDFHSALKDNDRALAYHPHFLNALNNSGLYYNSLKDYDSAREVLLRALEINPRHSDAHANLGIAYQGLQQFDLSVESLEKALQLAPDGPELRTYLAKAYYSQGEFRLGHGDTAAALAAYNQFLSTWEGDSTSAEVVADKARSLMADR